MATERELDLLIQARDEATQVIERYERVLRDLEDRIQQVGGSFNQSSSGVNDFVHATSGLSQSTGHIHGYTQAQWQMYQMQRAANQAMQHEWLQLARSVDDYGGSTQALLRDVDALGERHKDLMDNMVNNNDHIRASFLQGIGVMQAASTLSENTAKNIARNAPVARALDRAFLGVSHRLEEMAKRGNVARIALEELGPTAKMSDLLKLMRQINQQAMGIQMLQLGALIVTGAEIVALVKLSNAIDGRLIPAFENFKEVWMDALTPFIKVVTDVFLAVLNFGTAIGEVMKTLADTHPLLSAMVFGFLALIPPLTLLLAPLALGLAFWRNYQVMFAKLFMMIKPVVTSFFAIIGTVLLVSAAIIGAIAAFDQMMEHSGKLREAVSGLGEAFGNLGQAIWKVVGPIINTAISSVLKFLQALTGAKTMGDFWQKMGDTLAVVINGISTGINAIAAAIGGDFSKINKIFTNISNAVQAALPGILTALQGIAMGIINFLVTNGPQMLQQGIAFVTNLVQGMSEKLASDGPSMLQKGVDFINNLLAGIIQALPGILEAGNNIRMNFLNGLIQAMPSILNAGIQIINMLIQGIVTILPLLVQQGVQLVMMLSQGITQVLPQLITLGIQLIQTLLTAILGMIPQLLQLGLTIITTLLNAIVANLPLIIQAAIQIITTLLNAIVTQLPMIVESGINILVTLIDAIASMIPQVVPVIIDFVMSILDVLIQNLPLILNAGIEIVLTLIDGLIQVLPSIVQAAVQLITALLEAILKNLPKLLAAGVKLIGQLIVGIGQMVPQVIGAILQLTIALVTELLAAVPKLLSAGVKLITALIKGIGQMIGGVVSGMADIGRGIMDTISGFDLTSIGSDMISGLVNGIKSMASSVVSAAKGVVGSAVEGAKKLLNINSPSKVLFEIGEFFSEGYANGITKAAALAKKASINMTQESIKPVEKQRFPVPTTGGGSGTSTAAASGGNTTIQVTIQQLSLPNAKDGQTLVDQLGQFGIEQAFRVT